MQAIVALILALLVQMQAHAEEDQPVIEKINAANRGARRMTGPAYGGYGCATCAGAHSEVDVRSLARQCVRSLCPKGYGSRSSKQAYAAMNYLSNPSNAAAFALPASAVRNAVADRKFVDEAMLKMIASKEPITAAPALRIATIFRGLGSARYLVSDEKGGINEGKSLEAIKKAGFSEKEFLIGRKYLEFYREYWRNGPGIFIGKSAEFVNATMTPEKLRAEIRARIKEQEELSVMIAKNFAMTQSILFGQNSSNQDILKEIESGKISEHSLRYLAQNDGWTKYLSTISADKAVTAMTPKTMIAGTDLPPGYAEQLKQRIATADAFLNGEAMPDSPYADAIKSLSANCVNSFATAMAMSAPEPEIEKFIEKEKGMRAEFLNKVSGHLSEHSARTLNQAAKDWKLGPILSRSEFMASARKRLDEVEKSQKATAKFFASKKPEEKQIIFAVLGSGINPEEKRIFENLQQACEKSFHTVDHALPQGNLIGFTSKNVMEPEHSKSVAFHEYAHMTSGFISTHPDISAETLKWYNDKMSCLAKQHKGDKPFNEEDWAELLSNAVNDDPSYICMYDFSSPDSMTLKQIDPKETHSSGLYAILIAHLAQGKEIPAACKQALAMHQETELPANCMAESPTAR